MVQKGESLPQEPDWAKQQIINIPRMMHNID